MGANVWPIPRSLNSHFLRYNRVEISHANAQGVATNGPLFRTRITFATARNYPRGFLHSTDNTLAILLISNSNGLIAVTNN
ncbi:MAG: hypothetical protein GY820_44215 [Gammaproteobacteria bacterium]|nr:hypothetical protein [Gammaproteobacteria bacterium]